MLAERPLLLDALDCAWEYPRFRDCLPGVEMREGKYVTRFARNHEDLDEILKLRFNVFNLELGEGLETSFLTGRDLDDYDQACHHLMVVEEASGDCVGTYRVQTGAMAAAAKGFYSSAEFDLSHLPAEVLEDSIELGRACIAGAHRNTPALFLLWKGLAAYVTHNRKRFLFGCCSLASQDEREGKLVMEWLEREGHLHPDFYAPPQPGSECYPPGFGAPEPFEIKLPKLFRTYLRLGAKVCGPPVIDHAFKTIDYFVIFDVFSMDSRMQRVYFGA